MCNLLFLFSTIELWNLELNKNIHTFEEHKKRIWSVVISLNGKYLASGSEDH